MISLSKGRFSPADAYPSKGRFPLSKDKFNSSKGSKVCLLGVLASGNSAILKRRLSYLKRSFFSYIKTCFSAIHSVVGHLYFKKFCRKVLHKLNNI